MDFTPATSILMSAPTLMLRSTSVVSTTVAMASIMSSPISTVFRAWSLHASGRPETQ